MLFDGYDIAATPTRSVCRRHPCRRWPTAVQLDFVYQCKEMLRQHDCSAMRIIEGRVCMWQGTGPFGMPGLDGVQAFVRQLQAQATRVWPQVRAAADVRDHQNPNSNTT